MTRALFIIFLLTLSPPSFAASEPERFAGKLHPCEGPPGDLGILCGEMTVAEDPGSPDGRMISLHVEVLPATGNEVEKDALAFLAGGGVSPATRLGPFMSRALLNVRRSRDIVLVDQRGTGRSNPLRCLEEENDEVQGNEDRTKSCLDTVQKIADPRFYVTPLAMDDLDAVRSWLGYEQWTLWGASYGTKAARVYLRRHPERVRAVVLHGVVPLGHSMWPEMFVSGQTVLDRLISRCLRDEACSAAHAELPRELRDVTSRLTSTPATVSLPPLEEGDEGEDVELDRQALGQALYGALGSTRISQELPRVIHAAAEDDLRPLAELLRAHPGPPIVPRGVYLSIACSEEIPRLKSREPSGNSTLDDGTWLEEQIEACKGWPAGHLPDRFYSEPKAPDGVSVLVLSPAEDPITPPEYGAAVAAALGPGALHFIVPDRSHNDLDPCLVGLIETFIINGGWNDLPTGCLGASSRFSE